MKLLLSKSAKEEYDLLKVDAPELADRVKSILKDTVSHPGSGAGAPIKLEGTYAGFWQRTYAPGMVIVYSFDNEAVTIVSIGAKDAVLEKVHLESYSDQDEKSVMEQMSANRGKDNEPKVGIFWYNRATNQLFGVVSHRVSDYTKANASGGQVFYHIDDGTYEVAVGKWFEEYPQAYKVILEEFNLPAEKTKAKYAIHWDIGQSWR